MAGLTIHKRAKACYHLVTHEFDIDGTIEYVLREFADEPAVQRATNPRKLARNIVTIGGTGDQQEMNLTAFRDALRWLDEDRKRNRDAVHQREIEALKAALDRETQRANAAEMDFRRVSMRELGPGTRDTAEPIPSNS